MGRRNDPPALCLLSPPIFFLISYSIFKGESLKILIYHMICFFFPLFGLVFVGHFFHVVSKAIHAFVMNAFKHLFSIELPSEQYSIICLANIFYYGLFLRFVVFFISSFSFIQSDLANNFIKHERCKVLSTGKAHFLFHCSMSSRFSPLSLGKFTRQTPAFGQRAGECDAPLKACSGCIDNIEL